MAEKVAIRNIRIRLDSLAERAYEAGLNAADFQDMANKSFAEALNRKRPTVVPGRTGEKASFVGNNRGREILGLILFALLLGVS